MNAQLVFYGHYLTILLAGFSGSLLWLDRNSCGMAFQDCSSAVSCSSADLADVQLFVE